MRLPPIGHPLARLAAVAVACGVIGCADAGDDTRPRGPALDFADVNGLPDALQAASTTAVYRVHVPVDSAADEYAEVAFAITDGGYEMEAMEVGLAGPAVQHWLRFGIVQDLGIAPLGTRHILDPGGADHVWVHGWVDGIEYTGLQTEVDLTADLATGAIAGDFGVTLTGDGGPDYGLELSFTGQLERDCAGWIYAPGLDIRTAEDTGGDCAPVFAAIDATPPRDDGVELPPGFVTPARVSAE